MSAAGWGFSSLAVAAGAGVTCIDRVSAFSIGPLRSGLAGEVSDIDSSVLPDERVRLIARAAMGEACTMAKVSASGVDPSRVALIVGTTQGAGWHGGPLRLGFLTDPCDQLATEFGIGGPCLVVSTACTASTIAIAVGCDMLNDDQVDIAIVGGVDGLHRSTFAGFSAMRSLDAQPCGPYTRSTGLTIGEGAGFLVLERTGAAAARQVSPLAEVLACSGSSDGYHPTAPDPSGGPASSAMLEALDRAGLSSSTVGYVNGHGTGTAANDAMELRAMALVFRNHTRPVPLSSTKAMLGHTLGAAGVIEVAACVAALQGGSLPPNVHLDAVGQGAGADASTSIGHGGAIDLVAPGTANRRVDIAMSVNFGFGGSNAVALVGRARTPKPTRRPASDVPIVISGLGAFGALGASVPAWAEAIWAGTTAVRRIVGEGAGFTHAAFDPEPPDLEHLARSSWRRMDRFSRLCLTASHEAIVDAGLAVDDASMTRAVLVATACGPVDTIMRFNRAATADCRAVNPTVFVNSSPSAAAGYLSVIFRAHGASCTFPVGGIAAPVAISRAVAQLRRGQADVAIVVVTDHLNNDLLEAATAAGVGAAVPQPFGAGDGTSLGGASVAFVLERADHARSRGVSHYCRVLAGAAARSTDDDASKTFATTIGATAQRAGMDVGMIDYVLTAATGIARSDHAEASALAHTMSDGTLVGATTQLTGTCLSASSAVNVAAGALAIAGRGAARFVATTGQCSVPAVGPCGGQSVQRVLVNAHDQRGSSASLLLGGIDG